MKELTIDTRTDDLLSAPGIPFCIEYPELNTSLYVSLHLTGTMTYNVLDEALFAQAEPSVLGSNVCSALSIAISKAAERIGHPLRIPDHAEELAAVIHERLAAHWAELYGAEPGALTITDVSLSADDMASMEKMDNYAQFARKTPEEQASAVADMLRSAQAEAMNRIQAQTETWTCTCGTVNKGNYCMECGKMRAWICVCGTVNAGNFCTECGKPRT